jgi:hypothetical protein
MSVRVSCGNYRVGAKYNYCNIAVVVVVIINIIIHDPSLSNYNFTLF